MARRSGARSKRFVIQAPVETSDSMGGKTVGSYTNVGSVWCSVETLRDSEQFHLQQSGYADATHRLVTHAHAQLNKKRRLVRGSQVFEIVGIVDDDDRGQFKRLTCSEITSGS